ncbi:hypothetical protein PRIPAC_97126 [Pristionchus pacificus]|uniref:G protein-coupled receptor n=1 Tax=Pristionchus pacificus TaxID=54126 RepID=A0A2A6B2T3_PRIPA|nr:hypothetical protein PRIPAC_97126 [Pristionchus pacificus]|eukprot:PDM60184.1 G protein-coupled receptor [Pristionchus pacificus]
MAHPSDVHHVVESLQLYFFYFVGALSFLINSTTLAIIVYKSSILEREFRRLTLYLETSCLLQNLFYTILFIPFHYPRAGAGYCLGLLCGAVPYPILLLIFSILTMNMFSAFGMIIIARHQMLLFDDSNFKISTRLRQTWQQRGLNWYLFNRAGHPTLFGLAITSVAVTLPIGCTLIVAPCSHMITIVLRHVHSRRHDRVHLQSAQTVIIQLTVHVVFLAVPVFIITAVGMRDNIYADTQSEV